MRKSWDEYFLDMAFMVSTRGTCDRRRVGAALVKDKKIKSTGYNGSPSGMPHCDEIGHLIIDNHCIRTTHAEVNCLNNANVDDKKGAALYITDAPCINCQKLIISSGIKRVVYAREYKAEYDFLKEYKNIEVVCFKDYIFDEGTFNKKLNINFELYEGKAFDNQELEIIKKLIEIEIHLETYIKCEHINNEEYIKKLEKLYEKFR